MENIDPEYRATLDYLYGFVDYSLHRNYRYHPDQFELSRMVGFLAAIGDPQIQYPIIHVAGTKGKGSVSALCASALQAAGYKVGLYTSPHLVDFVERIQINRQPIPHQDFMDLVDSLRSTIESIPRLSFFEIATAVAFRYFAQEQVDVAVFEVGMGGRLDATNACHPVISVITNLSMDHVAILGDTLPKIAAEKAGIIKPGVPVVTAPQMDEALAVLRHTAVERKAPLTEVGKDVRFERTAYSDAGESLRVWLSEGEEPVDLEVSLKGNHQVENAVVAYTALKIFSKAGPINLTDDNIAQGFKFVKWPGRFEVINVSPLLIVDAAHNKNSTAKLSQTLKDYYPDHRVTLIFGASDDKDIAGMFSVLLPRVDRLVAVKSFHPRSVELEVIVNLARDYDLEVLQIPDVADAIALTMRQAGENDLVLVTGSIYVVAGARDVWLRERKF